MMPRFSSTTRTSCFALYEIECARRLQRPDHADLVDVDANTTALLRIDAEQAQCFHEVEMRLARCHDAETRVRYVEDLAVNRVGGGEGQCGRFLRLESFLDLWSGKVRPAVVQAGRRHDEVAGVTNCR